MPATIENYCEQVAILLLAGQVSLAGFSLVRFDEDGQVVKDRIVVKASPREVELNGINQQSVFAWRIPLSVTVHLVTRSEAAMDSYILAVQNAFTGTPAPTAVTLALAQFPGGLQIDDTDDGERENDDNARNRTKSFNFIAKS